LTELLQKWSGYELFVSWRYLRSKRKDVFISLISTISISGVALGVMALIIVLAVMTGLTGELRDKILGTHSHILMFKRGGWIAEYPEILKQTAEVEQVVGVAPFILRQVMIQSDKNSLEATLKGVDSQAEQTTTEIGGNILPGGTLDFLDTAEGAAGRGIILGMPVNAIMRQAPGDARCPARRILHA
jgi:lipoprotein-releasing system permease protein